MNMTSHLLTWFGHALAVGLVLGYPLWGLLDYRRLQQRLVIDPAALSHMYVRWIWQSWAVAALAMVAALSFGIETIAGWFRPTFDDHELGFLFGLGIALLVGSVVPLVLLRKKVQATLEATAGALLPGTATEKWLFAALSITAGITEEVVFRGFLSSWVQANMGLASSAVAIVCAISFGLGHLYQGWKGVLSTGLLGFGMAKLFLLTGTLWAPMALHALIDLRVLLMLPRARGALVRGNLLAKAR